MAYAPEKWRARGWFGHASRLGLVPDAMARAAHAFGPYAQSALAELNAPPKTETTAQARPRGGSHVPDGLGARLREVEANRRTEPAKKSSPILAPRNTLPVRLETKSARAESPNHAIERVKANGNGCRKILIQFRNRRRTRPR
ncbi:hypothetical protein W911_02230 [Hyphomicrobium nitrativorans NL23]|uniref:Uncharacterized protein n=1 Tax=Hyphomicrobium nitrativorans NL23 TaxID=1029756 RepID=V5SIU5_9HYPH|nr:hypothetical protein W911_02230 [Hyphomicrobium nitrativorans NL23]